MFRGSRRGNSLRSAVAVLLLFWIAGLSQAQAPQVHTSGESVTVALGERSLSADLRDGTVTFRTPTRTCRLKGSFQDGDGWTEPMAANEPPATQAEPDRAVVQVRYPLTREREVTLELAAYRDLPALFLTCRLQRLRSTGVEYYYWQSDAPCTRYFAPGPDGPQEVACDLTRWEQVLDHDWIYLPGERGGLVFLPTNISGHAPGQSPCLFLHALPTSDVICPGYPLQASFGIAEAQTPEQAAELSLRARSMGIPALEPWAPERLPVPAVYGPPAPAWLREAELGGGYYRPAALWDDAILRGRLGKVPFVIGSTPDKAALDRCHRAGVRVLHYVVYTCLLDTELQVREGGTVYSEWSESIDNESRDLKDHPDWVCIAADGSIQRDAWGQAHGHPGLLNTCLHQPGLHEAALRQIRMLMGLGFDGVFIDLAGPTVECYGPQFGKHSHPNPNRTNTDAYEELLWKIYHTVKSYGDDRVVVHNTVVSMLPSHWEYADSQMLEAFPFAADSAEPRESWAQMRWRGALCQHAREHGKVPLALPYFGGIPPEQTREAALFSYAYCRLYGFLWNDYFTLADALGEAGLADQLYRLRLGSPVGEAERTGDILFRRFERGTVALNPLRWNVIGQVPVPGAHDLTVLGHDQTLEPKDGRATLEFAPRSGRILIPKGDSDHAVP